MDQQSNPQTSPENKAQTVTTTVTCPHCNKQHEVKIEIPEPEKAPRLSWEG
jgi:transcription elongation factor Elf1